MDAVHIPPESVPSFPQQIPDTGFFRWQAVAAWANIHHIEQLYHWLHHSWCTDEQPRKKDKKAGM